MRQKSKASRPRQRTARTVDALPGVVAFYDDSLSESMIEGVAQPMSTRPHFIGAFGTIETMVRGAADRPVVLDARKTIDAPRVIRRCDGRERCKVSVSSACGGVIRVGIDALAPQVADVIRKAKG
jgi:hypothetical protein